MECHKCGEWFFMDEQDHRICPKCDKKELSDKDKLTIAVEALEKISQMAILRGEGMRDIAKQSLDRLAEEERK